MSAFGFGFWLGLSGQAGGGSAPAQWSITALPSVAEVTDDVTAVTFTVALSGSSASPVAPATIDIAAVAAPYSNTVVAGDIEGDAFPSATLSFIEDGEQGWTVYVTSVDEDKVLRAAISDPSEGEIAGASHADTVITDTIIVHNNPTIAGDFVVGSTVTATYDSGPDEVKWQSAPWNGGSPDTWTDIGGATAGSYLITGDMNIKSLRIAVRYGADWLYSAFSLPVEGYWPLTGATPGTQIEALTGIHAGLVTSGTDEAKLVVKAQSGGSLGPWIGLSSAASGSNAVAFDSGNSDQTLFFRLGPGAPPSGVGYVNVSMRRTEPGVSPYYFYTIQLGSTVSKVTKALNAAGVDVYTFPAGVLGTGKANCGVLISIIGDRLFVEIETTAFSGTYTSLTPGGGLDISSSVDQVGYNTWIGFSFPYTAPAIGIYGPRMTRVASLFAVNEASFAPPSGGNVVLTLHGEHGAGLVPSSVLIGITAQDETVFLTPTAGSNITSTDGVWTADLTLTQAQYNSLLGTAPTFSAEMTFTSGYEASAAYRPAYFIEEPYSGTLPFRLGMNVNYAGSAYSALVAKDVALKGTWTRTNYQSPYDGTFALTSGRFPSAYPSGDTGVICKLWEGGGSTASLGEHEVRVENCEPGLVVSVEQISNFTVTQAWSVVDGTGTMRFTFSPTTVAQRGLFLKISGTLNSTNSWTILPVGDASPEIAYQPLMMSDYQAIGTKTVRWMSAWDINGGSSSTETAAGQDRGWWSGPQTRRGVGMFLDFCADGGFNPWINVHDFTTETGLRALVAQDVAAGMPGDEINWEWSNEVSFNTDPAFVQTYRLMLHGYEQGLYLSTPAAQSPVVIFDKYASSGNDSTDTGITGWVAHSTTIESVWYNRLLHALEPGDRVFGNIYSHGLCVLEALTSLPASTMFKDDFTNAAGTPVLTRVVTNNQIDTAWKRAYALKTKWMVDIVADEYEQQGVLDWRRRVRFLMPYGGRADGSLDAAALDYADMWDYPIKFSMAPYISDYDVSSDTRPLAEQLDGAFSAYFHDSNGAAPTGAGTMVTNLSRAKSLRTDMRAKAEAGGHALLEQSTNIYEWLHHETGTDGNDADAAYAAAIRRDFRMGQIIQMGLQYYGNNNPGGELVLFADYWKEAANWAVWWGMGERTAGSASGNINPIGVAVEEWKEAWENDIPVFHLYTKKSPIEGTLRAYIYRVGPLDSAHSVDWAFSLGSQTGSVSFAAGEWFKPVSITTGDVASDAAATFGLTAVTGTAAIGTWSDEIDITVRASA